MHKAAAGTWTKVPAITLGFWFVKILATTLGETGGDTVSMSWLGETTGESEVDGYLVGSAFFLPVLAILVFIQVRATRFHPFLYWATIIASTTAGTTMADFATRSMGIGYPGGSLLLLCAVIGVLAWWRRSQGSVAVETIVTPRTEVFYWATITISQTLGTALGDWVADSGPGYDGGALLFGSALALLAALHFWTRISRVVLFWTAFILTRPLGATLGDYLDKPVADGGLAVSRPLATAALLVVIAICILVLPQKAAKHPDATA
ncbi:MAG TPA: hypothetical protein VM146_04975 [Steroidobacteraceae bacterium]|nr:hypothetical protein [Steroidobacteraceae bacterium]